MPPHSTCSVSDCDRLRRKRGWCELHYRRWHDHGSIADPRPSSAERFWAKVGHRGPGDCWLWLGSQSLDGYGRFRLGSHMVYAHRWAYEAMVGPIPDGLTIDHLCRTPACVNSKHLEVVTMRENVLRGVGPSAQNAHKTHCVRGHAFDQGNTYIRPDGDRSCRACHATRKKESRRTHQPATAE